jgi:alpha-N-arabinofuranosidase
MLYGGFIELLDDLVPGMWAEMLNDRGFEGVKPNNWIYYTGEPNTCDRDWDKSDSWRYDTDQPFNGKQSARVTITKKKPASLIQKELTVNTGIEYAFTGNFKADNPSIQTKVIIKSLLPNGKWMILGSAPLPKLSNTWSKVGCSIKSKGTTDKAVFELQITGSGNLWADKLSLMPTDNVNGWRKDVVEVIKAAHPGVIRFGGSLTEFGYKWDKGTGDRDARSPFWNQYWGRWDTNDVGIGEFIDFCRAVDAEPLICVSFNEGVTSACDLLDYCNGDTTTKWGRKRAENGHPKPYNVKYWQVGNECWGEKYDRACVDFCSALQKVDPKIVLLAADDTPLLLEGTGQYLNYVSHHYYYIKDAEGCQSSIKEQQKVVKDANLDHEVKMAITEWNITAADWGLGRGQMLTLGCALNTAEFLNVMHNCSDFVGLACRSNMTNSCCSGYIATKQSGVLKTPCYHVMKLYADHYKPVPVEVTAQVKGVDISACRSDDGKKLTVFAVNTTDAPVEIRLDISTYPGLTPIGGEVVCDTQDKRQPDLMNHWTAPDRVKAVTLKTNSDVVILPAMSVAAIECSNH